MRGGLPSDVPVVGVWREGMLYLTNTLSGVGEVYQTAFYGLPSDVAVVGVWRELSADQVPPPVVCTVPQCPWGGTYLPSTDECQYTFNAQQRKAAAEWARHWTSRACPLFCAFNFASYVDWTHFPTGTPRPYGHGCAGSTETDCANFVSQALFFAGFPMTEDWFCYYVGTANGLCNRGQRVFDGIAQASKWSWAPRYPLTSPFQAGLPAYLGDPYYLGNQPSVFDSLLTPPAAGNLNAQTRPPLEEANFVFNQDIPMPTSMPNEIQELMAAFDVVGMTYGDVMYTRNTVSIPNFYHVYLVVGWGPYVETWEQLSQVDLSQLTAHRQHDMQVLYVADHGSQQLYALGNPSAIFGSAIRNAKPYYSPRWLVKKSDTTWFIDYTERHFIHIPSILNIPSIEMKQPEAQVLILQTIMPTICPVDIVQ